MDEETRAELKAQLARINTIIEVARESLDDPGQGPMGRENSLRLIREAQRKRDELEERLAKGGQS